MGKKILIGLLVVLVVIQFIRPAKNDSKDFTKDITTVYQIPENVMHVLKRSCYDCHSNYTTYPWYSKIQPVAWWLQHHINEGKQHLNFSEFSGYALKKQAHKLEETAELIEKSEMPLGSYTFIHKDAVLDEQDATLLVNWARSLQAEIEQKMTAN